MPVPGVFAVHIEKLSADTLRPDHFQQMVQMEKTCGLDPYSPEMLMECITEMDTYACFMGDDLAGFITVHPSTRYLGGGVYIVNLNVAAAYRRQGIGKTLILTACSRYTSSHKGQLVTLDVARDNAAAMALYRNLGFSVTDLPSGNGDTDVVMTIPLDQLNTSGCGSVW